MEREPEGRAGGSALGSPGSRRLPVLLAVVLGVPLVLQTLMTEVCAHAGAGVSARVCIWLRSRRCRCERALVRGRGGGDRKKEGTRRAEILDQSLGGAAQSVRVALRGRLVKFSCFFS